MNIFSQGYQTEIGILLGQNISRNKTVRVMEDVEPSRTGADLEVVLLMGILG